MILPKAAVVGFSLVLAAVCEMAMADVHGGSASPEPSRSADVVILYDWERRLAKNEGRPGVLEIAFPYAVTFDSRRDGRWIVHGDVLLWELSIRAPGASSIAAEIDYVPAKGAVLEVEGEFLTRATDRWVSRHSGSDHIVLKVTAPRVGGEPTVKISGLRLSEPKAVAKADEVIEFENYNCHRSPSTEMSSRASVQACIDGSICCSATLINNATGPNGGPRPMIITAEHCRVLEANDFGAKNLRMHWNYEIACGETPIAYGVSLTDAVEQSGGRSVVFWENNYFEPGEPLDAWLIELDQWPPAEAQAAMAGFDARFQVPSGIVHGIHFGGAMAKQYLQSSTVKMISNGGNGLGAETSGPGTIGGTRPGSSGSGLFSAASQVLGTLIGSGTSGNTGEDEAGYSAISAGWATRGLGQHLVADPSASLQMAAAQAPLPPDPPTLTMSVMPQSIEVGETATLTWAATNARSCVASGSWAGEQAISGTLAVSPQEPRAYRHSLTCRNEDDIAISRSVVLVVSPPASGGGGSFGSGLVLLLLIPVVRRWCSRPPNEACPSIAPHL